MLTDIEIAQKCEKKPIFEIAKIAGVDDKYLEPYGKYKAKVDYALLKEGRKKGKLILVTAITPTPAGEGKTTTSIGLADGLRKIGKNTIAALREHGIWQKYFTKQPERFTREEQKAYLSTITGVSLGSDAFFPFFDNIERAKRSGVSYIAEPGGSVRDDLVIECADKYDMVMAFTGMRLFHH